MLPGPTIVKRCSKCSGLLKQRTISSGNTRRAKVWTDGEFLAPMLSTTPPLIRCGHCASIIWSQDLEKVDSYETYIGYRALSDDKDEYKVRKKELEEKMSIYESTPYYEKPSAEELFQYLGSAKLLPDKELVVRLRAWRLGNDIRRNTDEIIPLTINEIKNLKCSLPLLFDQGYASSLVTAEIKRELEDFDGARNLILNSHFSDGEEDSAEFILELIEHEDSQVCLITNDESREWRIKRRVNKRSKRPLKVRKVNPNGPPVFNINSRDWWFKVVGMLCHNWALIDVNPNDTVTVYFFQDHASSDGYDEDYDNQRFATRIPIIDSIDFDDLEDAKYALKNNSFDRLEENPGPWDGAEPEGIFYDNRSNENAIYSNGKYWK